MPKRDIAAAIARALAPGKFFVGTNCFIRSEHDIERDVAWEKYLGHLLDPAVARTTRRFRTSSIFLDTPAGRSETAMLALHYDAQANAVHVTRNLLTYGHQAYEAAPGVIETRAVEKWMCELVGSLSLDLLGGDDLSASLDRLVLLALIGTSRLPITSLESPLPAYSLGQIGYLPGAPAHATYCQDPDAFFLAAVSQQRPMAETAKALETLLRADAQAPAERFATAIEQATTTDQRQAVGLLRELFNSAALSPYTGLPEKLVAVIESLSARTWFGPLAAAELLGLMIRHLCRHLTAFDLSVFHNFGANYPDALFLDALLCALVRLLPLAIAEADAPTQRRLRRALRQGCLLRRHYEGLRVPDAPTSAGENARVLPAPFVRVPDEQIYETSKRRRVLFADQPTETLLANAVRVMLADSMADLDEPDELAELGTATFLDRPLGVTKPAGAIDQTPLLSHTAYSRFVANRRLAALKSAGWITAERHEQLRAALTRPPVMGVPVKGVPIAELNTIERPGVVSLADLGKVASDFIILRTTRGSLSTLVQAYDWTALTASCLKLVAWLREARGVTLVHHLLQEPSLQAVVRVYAADQLQLELALPQSGETLQQAGYELPARLRVLQAWDETHACLMPVADEVWITAH